MSNYEPIGFSVFRVFRWIRRDSLVLIVKLKLQPTSTEGNLLQMGWALHKSRSGQTRFSDNVREYLQKKFDIGEETGRKEDPAQIASDMRKARNTDGTRMFSRAEWLSKVQIRAFFSRISARRKQSSSKDS